MGHFRIATAVCALLALTLNVSSAETPSSEPTVHPGELEDSGTSLDAGCGCGVLDRETMSDEMSGADDSSAQGVSNHSEIVLALSAAIKAGTLTFPAGQNELLPIPGGEFTMGIDEQIIPADGEGPARRVRVSPFQLQRYEVSNWEWAEFVHETGFVTEAERYGWSFVFEGALSEEAQAAIDQAVAAAPWWLPVQGADWFFPEGRDSPSIITSARLQHPVTHISHNGARAYCAWRGLRLPREAEFERAARGGKENLLYPQVSGHLALWDCRTRQGYFVKSPGLSNVRCVPIPRWGNKLYPRKQFRANLWQGVFPKRNRAKDGFKFTAPVDAFGPQNEYGVYNIIGNVWPVSTARDMHRERGEHRVPLRAWTIPKLNFDARPFGNAML